MRVTEALRAIQVFNTHDLLVRFSDKGKDVTCHFHGSRSREMVMSGTRVYSPSHQTDPKAHFLDRGCKTFSGSITESLPMALAWASEKYGIREWATDPTNRNARVPLAVRERALDAAINARRS